MLLRWYLFREVRQQQFPDDKPSALIPGQSRLCGRPRAAAGRLIKTQAADSR